MGLQRGKVGSMLRFIRPTLWAVRVCISLVSRLLFFVGCLSLGPRKNDLTNYWALGPFVRPFTSLVDPGDIYPPQQDTPTCGDFLWTGTPLIQGRSVALKWMIYVTMYMWYR
jgi:hypothetical protein